MSPDFTGCLPLPSLTPVRATRPSSPLRSFLFSGKHSAGEAEEQSSPGGHQQHRLGGSRRPTFHFAKESSASSSEHEPQDQPKQATKHVETFPLVNGQNDGNATTRKPHDGSTAAPHPRSHWRPRRVGFRDESSGNYDHGLNVLEERISSGLQVHALQEPTVQVRESRPARHRQDAGATRAAPQSVKQKHDNLIGAVLKTLSTSPANS